MTDFRVAARMKAEGRLLIVLAFALMAFAGYFVVGLLRGSMGVTHLVIAVLSLGVAVATIWSQQRGATLIAANSEQLVLVLPEGTVVHGWDEVSRVSLAAEGTRPELEVLLADDSRLLFPLERASLPPLEVLHGIRTVAPLHVA